MEESFTVGRFRVSPATGELWRDGVPAPIGRRAFEVLVALMRRPGEVVTRDELIAQVWGGAVVEDNAIAAQMVNVRRALGEGGDGARLVVTVPGRGYRLVAPGASQTRRPQPEARRGPRRGLVAAGLILIILICVATGAWWTGRPWRVADMETFPASPVVETDAAPSPSGAFIAYAAGPERDDRRVMVRNLTGGEPLAFTSGAGDDSAPAWSPTSDRIAFVRSREGRTCAIILQPFPAGPEREVGRCRGMWSTTLAWSKAGEALFFVDRPDPGGSRRIERLDVASGAVLAVTTPPTNSDGDSDPSISPDGHHLAFQRDTPTLSRAVVRDLATGAERIVTPAGANIANLVWADDHTLIGATIEPDASALWAYPANGGSGRLLNFNPAEFRRIVSNGAGLVGFETHAFRHDLAPGAATASGEAQAVESGPGVINGLNFHADGALAFAQSTGGLGSWEVWVKEPDGPARKITNLRARYVESPTWSPDGRRLVFEAALESTSGIFVIQPDGSGLRRLTGPGAELGGGAWSADGRRVFYLRLHNRRFEIWTVDIDHPGGERPFDTGAWSGVRTDGKTLYALSQSQGGIWRLGTKPTLVAADIFPRHALDWDVVDGRLVYLDRSRPGMARLVVDPLAGGADSVTWAPRSMALDWVGEEGVFGGVSFDPISNRPVYVREHEGDSRIGYLRLKR